jgi:hypothetical protein
MHPKPMAETSKLLFPSLRVFILLMFDVINVRLNDSGVALSIAHRARLGSRDRVQPIAILREKVSRLSQRITELRWRHADDPPEDLGKMARARVANFERDLDETPGGFADKLLSANNTLSLDELQWRHPRDLLEHPRKVE